MLLACQQPPSNVGQAVAPLLPVNRNCSQRCSRLSEEAAAASFVASCERLSALHQHKGMAEDWAAAAHHMTQAFVSTR